MSYDNYRERRVFTSLDGVRALSVVAVVWHHAGPRVLLPMSANGFLGVDVFFVVSGFLIVTLLLRERQRHGAISLRDFYVRRTLRIFPLYYAILIALVALSFVVDNDITRSARHYAPLLFSYTADFVVITGALSVTWSLAAEEQFYLVWPAVERWFSRSWWLPWIVALVVSQAFNFGVLDPMGLHILEATFTPILLGVGLAHALHDPRIFNRVAGVLGHPATPWICLALLLAIVNIPGDVAGTPRLAVHVVVTAGLGSLVLRDDTLAGVLSSWPLRRIGAVSYGVYLLHMFVMVVIDRAVPGLAGVVHFAAVLLGTWVAAEISYRLFERRFLALKHRFAR